MKSLLLCACLLWRAGVVEGLCAAPRPLARRMFGVSPAPQRRAGATTNPSRGRRTGTVVWAASDETGYTSPDDDDDDEQDARRRRWRMNEEARAGFSSAKDAVPEGTEERALRLKQMLEVEDFAGAALESAAALEILPGLADVARMRGRALLDPLLDQMIDGAVLNKLDFEEAYEAFRLAAVMDPPNMAEAREELGRIEELCKRLPDGDEAIETDAQVGDGKGSLRFDIGARVECNRAGQWESGTVVGLHYREPQWPPDEVVPYQVRLNDGTLIWAPSDSDTCIRVLAGSGSLDDQSVAGLDVIIVGAGAAGIGCAFSLTQAFGLDPSRVLLLERGDAIGTSFRSWPEEMRFISPSFNQQGWTSSFDLNAVAHDTSPAFVLHAQHPSGAQYAEYLNALATDARLDVRLRTEVTQIERVDGGFDVRVRETPMPGAQTEETLRARYVVWAAGEFQYPREKAGAVPGAEHCVHNSRVRSWADLPGDERVIIGGCVHPPRSPLRRSQFACTPPAIPAHSIPRAVASLLSPLAAGTRAAWTRRSIWQRRASGAPCSPPPPPGMCRLRTRPLSWRPTPQNGFAR